MHGGAWPASGDVSRIRALESQPGRFQSSIFPRRRFALRKQWWAAVDSKHPWAVTAHLH
jgi:hypothetical protein